jgi:lysophospholipase L1-like esterase
MPYRLQPLLIMTHFVKTMLFFWRFGWERFILLLISALLGSGFMAVAQTSPTANCPPTQCVPIMVRRLPLGPPKLPISPLLKAPVFEQQTGNYPYGTTMKIIADNLPAGAVVERSWDNGLTWTVGTDFTLLWDGAFLARLRQDDQVSEVTQANFGVYYQRMFVLGNSIMQISPAPDIGWYNNNGMAASAPEKDFVHLLQGNLQVRNPQIETKLITGGNFERLFWSFDYADALDRHLTDYKPDLIIVRIGENVSEDEVNNRDNGEVFRTQYRALLDKLTAFSPTAKVICTTSFWNNPRSREIVMQVAAERGYPVADLFGELYNRPDHIDFTATQYTDPSVAAHPNDRGMAEIARLIWEKIR